MPMCSSRPTYIDSLTWFQVTSRDCALTVAETTVRKVVIHTTLIVHLSALRLARFHSHLNSQDAPGKGADNSYLLCQSEVKFPDIQSGKKNEEYICDDVDDGPPQVYLEHVYVA